MLLAVADARQKELEGRGEGQKVMQVGLSEAAVQLKKISSYGDPRLYALSEVAGSLSASAQPLVPERLFVTGRDGKEPSGQGMFGTLLELLVAERSGLGVAGPDDADPLKRYADTMSERVLAAMTAGHADGTRPEDQPAA